MPFLLVFVLVSFLYAKPVLDTPADVKRFPFIAYKKVWTGTPAEAKDVAVPNVVIAYGKRESKSVVALASDVAYYLGQWSDDMGITPRLVRKGRLPKLTMPLEKALKTKKNIILIGTNNQLVKELKLKFNKPTLKVVEWKGRKVLIVGGKNSSQVLKAGSFLAHRVIGFKAGAYRTFFSFVKLRGLIEHENFKSAELLIKDPSGLSACGKNMSLASPMMVKFPPEVKKVVKKRNRIMYVELLRAVREGNKEEAVRLWKSAMVTCYQCHQGLGVPRLRKFIPNPDIHSKHQRIAMEFGLIKRSDRGTSCTACHSGATEQRGY